MKKEIRAMLEFGIEEHFLALTTRNNQLAITVKNCDNAFEILCRGVGCIVANIKDYCNADLGFVVTAEEFAFACNNFETCLEGNDVVAWGGREKKHDEPVLPKYNRDDTLKLLATAADAVATKNRCILYSLTKDMITFGSDKDFFHVVGLCIMRFETYAKLANVDQTLKEFVANINEILFNRNLRDSQISYYFNQ